MADTCCTSNLNPCDGLVTIGYMRQLASGTCKTVASGKEYSGCCDKNNIIRYTAPSKLDEVTSSQYGQASGLHTYAFNTSIKSHIFEYGNGTIIFNGDVTRIEREAFYHCGNMNTITIPKSVKSIALSAFDGCQNLGEITCYATSAPSVVSTTFIGIKSNGTLHVPQGSSGYDTWMSTENYYLGKYNWSMVEDAVDYNGIDNSFYVPTYSEISDDIYADLRSLNDNNPNLDASGFIYEAPSADTSCCNINLSDKALRKSELSFGYTEVSGNTFGNIMPPTQCNLTFSATEYRGYYRHIVSCSGDTVIDDKFPITIGISHSSAFTNSETLQNHDINGENEYDGNASETWTIDFSPSEIVFNGITENDCGSAKTSSTSASIPSSGVGYEFVNGETPSSSQIPCDGKTFEISVRTLCNYIQITNITNSSYINGVLSDDNTVEINGNQIRFKRNDNASPGGIIKVVVKVLENTYTFKYEYTRRLCEWSPKEYTSEGCSIFAYNWEWTEPNEEQHSCGQ